MSDEVILYWVFYWVGFIMGSFGVLFGLALNGHLI